ncbi:hypothetical protein ACFWVM_16700 [Nocardia fluminea]|uniref:hypothetical protein n=1 Tax=Nocardia fluminea TaxID=134984 RepID=UPI0036554E48
MTGADHWTLAGNVKRHTGYWAGEFATPYRVFTEAGHDVVVATPGGVKPPVDPASLAPVPNGGEEGARKVAATIKSAPPLDNPVPLGDLLLADSPSPATAPPPSAMPKNVWAGSPTRRNICSQRCESLSLSRTRCMTAVRSRG